MPAFLLDLVLVDRLTGEVQTHKKHGGEVFFSAGHVSAGVINDTV